MLSTRNSIQIWYKQIEGKQKERHTIQTLIKKKATIAMFISNKIDFRAKKTEAEGYSMV